MSVKPWSREETDRFYMVLKCSGIDFSLMEQLYNRDYSDKNSINQECLDESIDKDEVDKQYERSESSENVFCYRDAKALKLKFKAERKKDANRVYSIAEHCTYNYEELAQEIFKLAQKNDFELTVCYMSKK